jgi:hypothetical protein
LGVKEYKYPNGVLPYCRVPKSKDDRSPIWNPVVKQDTLVIKIQSGTSPSAHATLGYIHEEIENYSGRHQMALPVSFGSRPDDPETIAVVAHEFGHVFGMWHEHQREDGKSGS